MISARAHRVGREVVLTAAAAFGVLCVLTALAAPLFGLRLLVFKSGSMGPDITTGAVAVSRTIPAGEVAVGDVVSVTSAKGTRITHRVVEVIADGGQVLLRLQGDANPRPDAEIYPVTEVDLVVGHVNGLGYVVDAAASPYALFGAGAAAAGLLVLTFRRRTDGEPDATAEPDTEVEPDAQAEPEPVRNRRGARGSVTAGVVAATAVVVGAATWAAVAGGLLSPTLAAFSDTAEVAAPVATASVPSPAGELTCVNGAIFSGQVHLEWAATGGGSAAFHYLVEISTTADPDHPVKTYTTATPNLTVGRSDLPGSGNYQVRVSGGYGDTAWRSAAGITRGIGAGGLGWEINC